MSITLLNTYGSGSFRLVNTANGGSFTINVTPPPTPAPTPAPTFPLHLLQF